MRKVLIRQYSLPLANYGSCFTHKVTPDRGSAVTLNQVFMSEVMVIADRSEILFFSTEQILLRLKFEDKRCAMIQNYLIFFESEVKVRASFSNDLNSSKVSMYCSFYYQRNLMNSYVIHVCIY